MNTRTRATRVQQYSSPLRISPEAVELRDITYPMADVKSVEVQTVAAVTNRDSWHIGIILFDTLAGLQLAYSWVDSRVWEGRADALTLAILITGTIAYLLIDYLLRWLYKRRTKKVMHIYTADLDTEYGRSAIVASRDKAYVEEIAATIAVAIAENRKTRQSSAQQQSVMPAPGHAAEAHSKEAVPTPVVYENYFRIDESSVSTPEWSTPISNLRSASLIAAPGRSNWDGNHVILSPLWYLGIGLVIWLQTVLDSRYVNALISMFGVILVAFYVMAKSKNRLKKEVPTVHTVSVVKLDVKSNEELTLVTIDYGFADKFVSSVREAVRKHKASPGRSTPATRSSPGST
ncbi:MAG TPA: hypothetical protein VEX13_03740 [Chloroflexia bacterium]|nr:hypothetical protein [Chloroflexia bacterium]